MEKRIFTTFKELIMADTKADGLDKDLRVSGDAGTISGGSADAGTSTDWSILSSQTGEEWGYSERIVHGDKPGGIRPIKDETEAERCIIAIDLLEPSDNRSISIKVSDPAADISDEVAMSTVKGDFTIMKKGFVGKILFEGENFFTVQKTENEFQTFLNLNDAANFGMLEHSDPRTFDHFRFSFLLRA